METSLFLDNPHPHKAASLQGTIFVATSAVKLRRVEDGLHLTFHCPIWEAQRTSLIGDRKSWESLDQPIWIKTGPDKEDIFDGGEGWCNYIFGFSAP